MEETERLLGVNGALGENFLSVMMTMHARLEAERFARFMFKFSNTKVMLSSICSIWCHILFFIQPFRLENAHARLQMWHARCTNRRSGTKLPTLLTP